MVISISWNIYEDEYPAGGSEKTKIADVMDLLVDKGFPTDQLKFPSDFNHITHLINKGAKLRHFSDACDLTMNQQQNDFDIRYFLRVAEKLISISEVAVD